MVDIEDECGYEQLYLERALEIISEGTVALDTTGKVIFANSITSHIAGVSPALLIGRNYADLTRAIQTPEGQPLGWNDLPIARILRTKKPVTDFEMSVTRLDGTTVFLMTNSAPIFDKSGEIRYIVSAFSDITKSKITEDELLKLRERMSIILEHTSDGFFTVNRDWRFSYVNETAAAQFGKSAKELTGSSVYDLFSRRAGQPLFQALEKAMDKQVPAITEFFIRPLGKWFDTRAYPFADGASVYFVDITERKEAEELNEALDRINDAIHSTLDFQEVMRRVVAEAAKALKAQSAAAAMRENGYWSGRYQFGFLSRAAPRLSEDEAELANIAIDIGKPYGINDALKEPRLDPAVARRYRFRSLLTVPVGMRGSFTGVLTFNYHTHAVKFSEAQLDFAAKLSTTVSLALENARLFEAEKRVLDYSNILNEINFAISSTRDIDEIMERVLDASANAIGCETAAITLREEEGWVLRYNYGFPKRYVGRRFTEEEARRTVLAARTPAPLVINDAVNDDRLNQEVVKALNVRSVLLVPLFLRNEVVGVLSFNYHSDAIPFKDEQVDFMKKVSASLSLAVDNSQLFTSQMNIANTLQEAVLALPERVPGVDFSHLYHSATESADVGGDFYDIFELEHGRLGIAIGDISGKGLEAATLTSLVKNTIKAYAFENDSPNDVARKTGNVFFRESDPTVFASLFFGIIDPASGELRYCNAGHPAPVLKRAKKAPELLRTTAPVLGAFLNLEFREEAAPLRPNDLIVLYTDGIIEARRKGELYGEERLVKTIKRARSIEMTPERILNSVLSFTHGTLNDDIAILAISLT